MEKYSDKRKKEIIKHFNAWIGTQNVFKDRQQMADYLHISKSHLGNIIIGKRKPSVELIVKIIVMTGFTTEEREVKKSELDRPYKELADELQRWFHRQNRWKTQKGIAQHLGVNNSYVSKFFMGRMFPGGETREKLFSITNIDILKPESAASIDNPIKESKRTFGKTSSKAIKKDLLYIKEVLEKIERVVNGKPTLSKAPLHNQNSAERIATTFYSLAEELLSFQDSTIEEREQLKRLVSPKDVGFIISFLKAIYDEDKFSDFIFFTKYELEGGF